MLIKWGNTGKHTIVHVLKFFSSCFLFTNLLHLSRIKRNVIVKMRCDSTRIYELQQTRPGPKNASSIWSHYFAIAILFQFVCHLTFRTFIMSCFPLCSKGSGSTHNSIVYDDKKRMKMFDCLVLGVQQTG